MKKALAMILVLVSLFSFAAYAETADEATAETAIELVPITFADGFQIALPGDWVELELAEEQYEAGIFYAAASPDEANTVQISWNALEAEISIEDVQADLVATYPDAAVVELNGIPFVGFTDTENDIYGFTVLDAMEPGLYTFWFTPASDEAFYETAGAILGTICNVEVEEVEEDEAA